MANTTNHTGLINAVYSYRRDIEADIQLLKDEVAQKQRDLAEAYEELRQLPSAEAMEDMTHQELADRVEGLIPDLPEHLLDNETPACPGCSGASVVSDRNLKVRRCLACDGVFTTDQPITTEQALAFVDIGQPMTNGPLGHQAVRFYFDLTIRTEWAGQVVDKRLHGWASKATKRVVQLG